MRERAAAITGQLAGHEMEVGDEFVVVLTDATGHRQQTPVTVRSEDGAYRVSVDGQSMTLSFSGPLRDIAVHGTVDGRGFCAQIERVGLNYRIMHNGLQIDTRVLSARAAELLTLMPFKAPPDLSRFLLSPMPGLLVDIAVQPGQSVRAGEKLAVIEAMKMENILLATQDGVVAKIAATKGESLSVDQVILEFQ
jgi:propionyl-CoA carboxylase alpha chain